MNKYKKNIAIFSARTSDFSDLLSRQNANVTVIAPEESPDLGGFDAVILLGGVSDEPLILPARTRKAVESALQAGKKVFAEYVGSIGHVYCAPPVSTRFERLAVCADGVIGGLEKGMLIEDQCNIRVKPYSVTCSKELPILQYVKLHAHDRVEMHSGLTEIVSDRGLWFDNPDNLLICSFRLADFLKARIAPLASATKLIAFIMEWLLDGAADLSGVESPYTVGTGKPGEPFAEQLRACTDKAMRWFEQSGVVYDEGASGALEGPGTEVYPDGRQRMSRNHRVDCIGEIALPYFLQSILASDERSGRIAGNLQRIVYDDFQCKDGGPLHGMIRWTEEAWGVCYQDDVARAILPQLLRCLYANTNEHLSDIAEALRFLVRTTGTDGTRVYRTDNINLTAEKLEQLRTTPGGLPSAHYNAYYYAALLLTYKLTGIDEFRTTAVKGLETIMSVYPHTKREQSETQEYCRLVLPLSWLVWVTGEERHREWLYRVAGDLQKFKHPSGAYLEWDDGYQAAMRHEIGKGESSLISRNGDPVIDLLYSNNWLPIGFIQAYFVTKDPYFKELWEQIAGFLISAQIHSGNPVIDGAWARAFDVDKGEVFGSPADTGWGPWSIESGWTMAEIASGLLMGQLEERLLPYYENDTAEARSV
ncbi:hypothetical protein FE783_15580 [Paenibacillus mesophilus]|uniref:hypothetical protein n=1 Tax=Paenibacillus mesophilus TaxID=2582849 RepID=UPI00110D3121|nr:hypothetical protein [Paenibacillus mesophilus]TMV49087.1 hypothetical protein FE783_15580 [Paenibacillus mesophilus]